ncbi:MAG: 6-carboxytetrahydropterin synthase [Candidatus Zixiibacteriota bacterium]|nr:MAG: 6-carboxytetrahydropterin synthase [candidate division Zixibacteria bacterium]
MYLSISKRFEFSSSHRLWASGLSDEENLRLYGREAESRHGHGHNFVAYFVFHGPVDDATGMMINIVSIKDKLKPLIDGRYDHKYLNVDTPPFDSVVPTPENMAGRLLTEARPLFDRETARPVACHLNESSASEATAYADGRVERHLWTDFSAARRTYSPHLTDSENRDLFGVASSPSGHGHHYRLRVTLGGEVDDKYGMIVPETEGRMVLDELRSQLDHRNLNTDVPDLAGKPMTTEWLCRYIFRRIRPRLPVTRVKLYEHQNFFVEYSGDTGFEVGVLSKFHAAHRLHSPVLSDADNECLYGKCHNLRGHGHLYVVEATLRGDLDEKTGTVYNLENLTGHLDAALAPYNYRHLDIDTDDFRERPSTGENIVASLWSRLEQAGDVTLSRVRLWETPNNRFTLRRDIESGES